MQLSGILWLCRLNYAAAGGGSTLTIDGALPTIQCPCVSRPPYQQSHPSPIPCCAQMRCCWTHCAMSQPTLCRVLRRRPRLEAQPHQKTSQWQSLLDAPAARQMMRLQPSSGGEGCDAQERSLLAADGVQPQQHPHSRQQLPSRLRQSELQRDDAVHHQSSCAGLLHHMRLAALPGVVTKLVALKHLLASIRARLLPSICSALGHHSTCDSLNMHALVCLPVMAANCKCKPTEHEHPDCVRAQNASCVCDLHRGGLSALLESDMAISRLPASVFPQDL